MSEIKFTIQGQYSLCKVVKSNGQSLIFGSNNILMIV